MAPFLFEILIKQPMVVDVSRAINAIDTCLGNWQMKRYVVLVIQAKTTHIQATCSERETYLATAPEIIWFWENHLPPHFFD